MMGQHKFICIFWTFLWCWCGGQESGVTFQLREELVTGTLVGKIANAGALPPDSTEDPANLRYTFLDDTPLKTLFSINDRSGELYTSVVIDRETVCGTDTCVCGSETCILEFEAAVHSTQSTQFFHMITVNIVIVDINDNLPTFDSNEITLYITESVSPGELFPIPAARDKDSGINSIQSYDITPGEGKFGLRVSKRYDIFEVQMIVKEKLDREVNDLYQVYVYARDGGSPQNFGMLTVNINVTDVNDNIPVFDEATYNLTIREDTPQNTIILRVSATDTDAGANGRLSYRFSPLQTNLAKIESLFSMDELTGELRVVGELVYEHGQAYVIIVEARDGGDQQKSDQTRVVVNIMDVGNNPPHVDINFLAPGNVGIVNISESSPVYSFVAQVKVEDSDTGLNGNVSCDISNSYFGLQSLGSKGYKVVVKGQLDREKNHMHSVVVTCQDRGTPVMSASADFYVRVTDFNDNTPQFEKSSYVGSVPENKEEQQWVAQVKARDADIGNNAKLHFVLHQDAAGRFVINPITGVISTNSVFDREASPQVVFRVLAVDAGTPPLTGTTTVFVSVTDENDNAPIFTSNTYSFHVRENELSDTFVDRVHATDLDEGDNAKINYFVSTEDQDRVPFVFMDDGELKTDRELDREVQSRYDFTVFAVNVLDTSLNDSARVTVFVDDDNDHFPSIVFPTAKNNTVSIPYLYPLDTIITTIRAYDMDSGINQKLTYSIVKGNEENIFRIDADYGNLFLEQVHEVVNDEIFPLVVSVLDMGNPQKESRTNLNIVLTYTNATSMLPVPSDGSKYAIIAVVVVIVTVIVSAAIIAVICIVRRLDQQKQTVLDYKYKDNRTLGILPNISQGLVVSDRTFFDEDTMSDLPKKKNKKEVSFSLDEEAGFNGNIPAGLQQENVLMGSPSTRPANTSLYPGQQMLALHSHQGLLQSKSAAPPHPENIQRIHQPSHQEDSHSQTSGETATSDSGHGGSEDDVQNSFQSPNVSRNFEFIGPDVHNSSSNAPASFIITCKPPNKPPRARELSETDRTVCNSPSKDGGQSDSKHSSTNHRQLSQCSSPRQQKNPSQNFSQELSTCRQENQKSDSDTWIPSYV